jgi:hypothetical protein
LSAFPVGPSGHAARVDHTDIGGFAELHEFKSTIEELLPER